MVSRTRLIQSLASSSVTRFVGASVGGLNSRDSLEVMPANDAVLLENFIAQAGGVVTRRGYTEFATGLSGNVETFIEFKNGATNNALAASDTNLYKITTGGAVSSLGAAFANARWQGQQLGGNMIIVNGADAPRQWDGTTLTTPVYKKDIATAGTTNMDGIYAFKNRMYIWDSGAGSFYFGEVNAIAGDFFEFDLTNVSNSGGNLMLMQSISRDGGDGSDDLAAFVLDTGEVLVYQGDDPGTAVSWSLIGRYLIPPPISLRSAIKFGGDVLVLTEQDLVSLGDVIKNTADQQAFNLRPTQLSGVIQKDFLSFSSNYGWELQAYGKGGWILINVPETTNSTYVQYIINTITGGASKFTSVNSRAWGILGQDLYFGGDTKIFKMNDGFNDDGGSITAIAQHAYNGFGVSNNKKFNNIQVFYRAGGSVDLSIGVGVDFESFIPVENVNLSAIDGAEWDVAEWDDAEWASDDVARNSKITIAKSGLAVSTKIVVTVQGQEFAWSGTNYNFEVESGI